MGDVQVDSLANFLYLSAEYFNATNDVSVFTSDEWVDAVEAVLDTFADQQQATAAVGNPSYVFQRTTTQQSETLQKCASLPHRGCALCVCMCGFGSTRGSPPPFFVLACVGTLTGCVLAYVWVYGVPLCCQRHWAACGVHGNDQDRVSAVSVCLCDPVN